MSVGARHQRRFLKWTIAGFDSAPRGPGPQRRDSQPAGASTEAARSLLRCVLLNRWRFDFELLHWCTKRKKKKKKEKTLDGQAVFLTSLTEAAHQMKGMCEIAFPSISVSMLRTLGFMRRMDHAAPSDVRGKKPKRVVIPHELASTIVQYDALRDDCFHAGCMRVNLQLNTQREGNRGGPVTSEIEHQSVT